MLVSRTTWRGQNFLYKYLPALLVVVGCLLFVALAHAQGQDFGLNQLGEELPLPGQEVDVREIVLNVLRYVVGSLGLVAVILTIYGGILWLTAGGDQTKVDKAKRVFKNALIGLVIILFSFAIVQWLFTSLAKVLGPGGEGGENYQAGGFGDSLAGKFKLVSFQPEGEVVPLCAKVQAVFNSSLDKKTVTDSVVLVAPMDSGPMSGTMTTIKNILSFSHADFLPQTSYNVVLKNSLRDVDGRVLAKEESWSFTTGQDKPKLAQVKATSPKNNQDNICLAKAIQVKFTEVMDLASFNTESVLLTDDKDQAVATRLEPMADFKGLTLWPTENLAKNTKYTLRLKASGFANACGESLDGNGNGKSEGSPADDFILNFKTGVEAECRPILSEIKPVADYYNNTAVLLVGQNLGLGGTLSFEGAEASGNNCSVKADFVRSGQSCLLDWADDYITTKVPVGADDGEVKVKIGDNESNGLWFEIKSPVLINLSPEKSTTVGSWVTIWGKNFGRAGKVWLVDGAGKKYAAKKTTCLAGSEWTDKAVIFEVPQLPLGSYQVGVEISVANVSRFSNLLSLEISAGSSGPGVCVVSPSCGQKAQAVVVLGKNFGASVTNASLIFGTGKVSGISRWAETSISATLPAVSQAGRFTVSVEKGGQKSNSVPYTVPCAAPPQMISQNQCTSTETQSPSPANGSSNVCLGASPSVRFTVDMLDADLLSLTKLYSCVGETCANSLPYKISWLRHNQPGEGIILTPAQPLKANTSYQVVVKAGARIASKESALEKDVLWRFTTGSEICQTKDLLLSPGKTTLKVGSTQIFTPLLQTAVCQLSVAKNASLTVDQGGYVNWAKTSDGSFSVRGDKITGGASSGGSSGSGSGSGTGSGTSSGIIKIIADDGLGHKGTADIIVIPPSLLGAPGTGGGGTGTGGGGTGTKTGTGGTGIGTGGGTKTGGGGTGTGGGNTGSYPRCGDAKVNQVYEQCDLGSLNGAVGSACTTYCQIASASACNFNNRAESNLGEFCDGTDLAGKTCQTFGFTSGNLLCNNFCEFNTSACKTDGKDIINGPVCGDKIKNQATEECDGGQGCTDKCLWTITPSGQCPAGTTKACQPGTTWSCTKAGFKSGIVKCTSTCQIDASDCSNGQGGACTTDSECPPNFGAEVKCGSAGVCSGGLCSEKILECPLNCNRNGVKEDKEQCDGTDFGALTCATETAGQKSFGALACSNTCTISTTSCKTKEALLKEKLGCAEGVGIKYLGGVEGVLDSYGLRLPYCDAPVAKNLQVVCAENLPGDLLASCQIYLGGENVGGAGVLVKKNLDYLLPEEQNDDKGRAIQGASAPGLGGFMQTTSGTTTYVSYARLLGSVLYSDLAVFSMASDTPPDLAALFSRSLQNIEFNGDQNLLPLEAAKLARDYRRISFAKRLINYRKNNEVSLPTEANFSYLKGITSSTWNSWSAVQNYLYGINLEVDPLNTYKDDAGECRASGFDMATCWNYLTKKAICPTGSHVYFYNYATNQMQIVLESNYTAWPDVVLTSGTVGGPACGGDKVIK